MYLLISASFAAIRDIILRFALVPALFCPFREAFWPVLRSSLECAPTEQFLLAGSIYCAWLRSGPTSSKYPCQTSPGSLVREKMSMGCPKTTVNVSRPVTGGRVPPG